MAQIFGEKSGYLVKNEQHNIFSARIVILAIFTSIFLYVAISKNPSFKAENVLSLSFAFIFVFVILKIFFEKYLSNFDKFNNGRKGEDEICDELKKLPEKYLVFQDAKIPGRGGNIDFIIVGPTGILAIEVKNIGGKIGFNGKKLMINGRDFKENKDFLRQTMSEAMDLNAYVKKKKGRDYFVTPVLVFANKWSSMKFGFHPINSVYVIGKPFLNRLIEGNNQSFTQADMEFLKNELLQLVGNK